MKKYSLSISSSCLTFKSAISRLQCCSGSSKRCSSRKFRRYDRDDDDDDDDDKHDDDNSSSRRRECRKKCERRTKNVDCKRRCDKASEGIIEMFYATGGFTALTEDNEDAV